MKTMISIMLALCVAACASDGRPSVSVISAPNNPAQSGRIVSKGQIQNDQR